MASKRYVASKIKTGYWKNSKDQAWADKAQEAYIRLSKRSI